MRNHLLFATILLAVTSFTSSSNAAESPEGIRVLVIATPRHVTFERDLSGMSTSTELIVANLYLVKLRIVRVVLGSLPGVQSLDVEMTADPHRSISSYHEIYVLLELQQRGNPRVLYWGVPETVACIPYELVKGTDMEADFARMHTLNDMGCSPVQ